ncbi:MAG: hypothetical protein U0838_13135 [Chloroflexota bacterium]
MGLDSLTLADVLTPAGFVAAAMLITGVIAVLKNVPSFGPWLDAGNEQLLALLLAGVLVVLAVVDAGWAGGGLKGLFQALLAWYGISALTVGTHAAGTGLQRALGSAS